MASAKRSTTDPIDKIFNTFTKSYKIRYVVHASRPNDLLTLCGRSIESCSTEPFDTKAKGACQKCIQKLVIESRIHPGWQG